MKISYEYEDDFKTIDDLIKHIQLGMENTCKKYNDKKFTGTEKELYEIIQMNAWQSNLLVKVEKLKIKMENQQ